MPDKMRHIASAVVKARPADQDAVVAHIATVSGAEVAAAERGRIIVVLEAAADADIADSLNRIAALDGVLSTTLVFEHAEPEGDLA